MLLTVPGAFVNHYKKFEWILLRSENEEKSLLQSAVNRE